MTKRTIFCASLLILELVLGATCAEAQTQAGTQSDRSNAASQVKALRVVPLADTPSVKGSGRRDRFRSGLRAGRLGIR